jgi:hypothetical protein
LRSSKAVVFAFFQGEKGGNPFGNMGAMMENIKKAQVVVQVYA